jgi:hypothetical protein
MLKLQTSAHLGKFSIVERTLFCSEILIDRFMPQIPRQGKHVITESIRCFMEGYFNAGA